MMPDFLYYFLRKILKIILIVCFRLNISKINPKPVKGPFIYAANHESFMDGLLLIAAIPDRIHFLVTEKYWMTRKLARILDYVVVSLKRDKNLSVVRESVRYLQNSKSLAIFPEGKIRINQQTGRAKNGVAFIANHSNYPVIPIGIAGASEILNPKTNGFRFARASVVIGNPIPPSENKYQMTDEIMAEIIKLKQVAEITNQPAWLPSENALSMQVM
jgi:1-acyl-sn-glycerol-3-phosphate acyltransferase